MTITEEASGRRSWYRIGIDETIAALDADTARGLTSSEVSQRQARYGPNVLAGKEQESPLRAFLRCQAAILARRFRSSGAHSDRLSGLASSSTSSRANPAPSANTTRSKCAQEGRRKSPHG